MDLSTAKRFLTEQEVATLFNLSPATLRTWRCRHVGPRFFKVGKRSVRYAFADLVDFIDPGDACTPPEEW